MLLKASALIASTAREDQVVIPDSFVSASVDVEGFDTPKILMLFINSCCGWQPVVSSMMYSLNLSASHPLLIF
jgi:hypothetical protein